MVRVRLMGDPAEVEAARLALEAAEGIEVVASSRPYANRGGHGVRVYLDAEVEAGETGEGVPR